MKEVESEYLEGCKASLIGPSNVKHMQDRVVAFAKAVARGDRTIPGAASFGNLKELVASAPKAWEASMEPPRQ